MDQVKEALYRGADKDFVGRLLSVHYGGPVLNAAVWNGHIDIVNLLISHGANIHAVVQDFIAVPCLHSPLHVACLFNHTEIAKILLANGADPKARIPKESRHHPGLLPLEAVGLQAPPPDPELV